MSMNPIETNNTPGFQEVVFDMIVGESIPRVDGYDKVTGRAKYVDDLCDKNALVAKICHAQVAHAIVKSVDISEAALAVAAGQDLSGPLRQAGGLCASDLWKTMKRTATGF